MWVSEKVTSLEKENGDLRKVLQDMEARLAIQDNLAKQAEERYARMEAAMGQIAEFVQQQQPPSRARGPRLAASWRRSTFTVTISRKWG